MSILNREKFGILLRAFTPHEHLVADRAQQVAIAVDKVLSTTVGGEAVVRRADILVWADRTNYPTDADCGHLATELNRRIKSPNVKVHSITSGDPFCEILNRGVGLQLRDRCSHSFILSSEASSYWTTEVLEQFIEALERGARVVGLALHEFSDLVMRGRIANTFSVWNNLDLCQVGLFDLRARKRTVHEMAQTVMGFSKELGDFVSYQMAAEEEVLPLVKMIRVRRRQFGPFIAPILPSSAEARYTVPDPKVDPLGYQRHLGKLATKKARQHHYLALEGVDETFLQWGVMPEYGVRDDGPSDEQQRQLMSSRG
jgi:hypothetical protein